MRAFFLCIFALFTLTLPVQVHAADEFEPCLASHAIEKSSSPSFAPISQPKLSITNQSGQFAPQGVAQKATIWQKTQTVAHESSSALILTVQFLGGTAAQQNLVKQLAPEWSKHANVKFQFRQSGASDIRVGFAPNDGNWSYVGSGSIGKPKTMNLALQGRPSNLQRRVILHEFGHALGLSHEHQSPSTPIRWNENQIIADHKGVWDEEKVRHNILRRLDSAETNYTAFDRSSIMVYPIPRSWNYDGFEVGWNTRLSTTDKRFIGQLYGKPGISTPKTDLIWFNVRQYSVGQLTSLRSSDTGIHTGITFMNLGKSTIQYYWVDYRGNQILYYRLPAGHSVLQPTFSNHVWLVKNSAGKNIFLFAAKPTNGTVVFK